MPDVKVLRTIDYRKSVLRYAHETNNVAETCRHFGISRPTFYEWRRRYETLGEAGLRCDYSAEHMHAASAPSNVVSRIAQLRVEQRIGPNKIALVLRRQDGVTVSPSVVWRILCQLGMNRLDDARQHDIEMPLSA